MVDYPMYLAIRRRYELLRPILDERLRRLWAAAEALTLGTGGITILANVTGLSRSTIQSGVEQLQETPEEMQSLSRAGRIRRPGAGRKSILETQGEIAGDIEALMESTELCGGPLLWTCRSIRTLAEALRLRGHQMSYRTVGNLLHRLGYAVAGKEAYRKFSIENRMGQFRLISRITSTFLRNSEPVLSVEIGKTGQSRLDSVSPIEREIYARPIHSIPPNHETASLAASMVYGWWRRVGRNRYLQAKRILLVADAAGRAASDREIWVKPLQVQARTIGLEILVSHFPPGARRWKDSQAEADCTMSIHQDRNSVEELTITLDSVLPSALGERSTEEADSPNLQYPRGESFEEILNYIIRPQP